MASDIYVIPTAQVRAAIDKLLSRDIHQHFPAYLHLRRESALQGRTDEIEPNWATLSEDLRMDGGPPDKVHLRPFWKGTRNSHQEWLAGNLQGSYAPSSIREALLSVVQPDAQGLFALNEDHAKKALDSLLLGTRLSGVALAAFWFRDRGWTADEAPTVDDLLAGFRSEFGYRPEDDIEFNTLYELDWGSAETWFEKWESSDG